MRRCMGCMEEYEEQYDMCPHCGYIHGTQPAEVFHLRPETVLHKRYTVGKVLGFGGFGVTYIGWDNTLETKVAIKEYMPSEFSTRIPSHDELSVYSGEREEQFAAGKSRFVDEAKRLAKFQSQDGIIQVYDSFEENKTAYIVMEYLEGITLKEKLDVDGIMPVEEAVGVIKPILMSLVKVHEAGIIHRDIAPDNIMLCKNGKVKLFDFGAARFATTTHSKSLSVILKPGYSPEEQYRSRGDQGPWTDVYSVAATLYKMITGITPQDAMERRVKDEVKEFSKLGIKMPKSTANSIMNALNIEVEGRTQSAQALLDDLNAEDVKRNKVKVKKIDIGKWPLWAKLTSGAGSVAVCSFMVLLLSGTIGPSIHLPERSVLPEGKCRVPNVINIAADEAEQKALAAELVYQITDKQYSNDVPEKMVLAQSLAGGSIVDKQSTIGVIISAGVEQTYMPNVIGFEETVAETMLGAIELDSTKTEEQSIYAPGVIVEQSVEPGMAVDTGSNIDLTVSKGMDYDTSISVKVPKITGKNFEEAATKLSKKSLYIMKTEAVYSDTVPLDAVVSQDVKAKTSVNQGSVIGVVVSLGKEQIRVPDVQYKELSIAKSTLEDLGFVVVVEYVESDSVAKDLVVSQDIAVGEMIDKGTTITIFVSKGNEKAEKVKADEVNITKDVQKQIDDQQKNNDKNKTDKKKDKKKNTESTTEKEKNPFDFIKKNSTVPNVVGQSLPVAKSSMESAGFTVSIAYKHSDSVQVNCVISQSIAGGTEMEKGSEISLVVCNNDKKMLYRTRSVKEETKVGTTNEMNGWTLCDTTTRWSDYGAWSDWSTDPVSDSDRRKTESKNQYSFQDKETTSSSSSSMSGWTLTRSQVTSYTNWETQTSTSKPAESDTVQILSSATKYNYFHYVNTYTNESGYGIDSVASGGTIKKNYGRCDITLDSPLKKVNFSDVGGKQCYGSYTCSHNFNYWFLAGTTTTYTYQTRSPIYTYYFEKWGNWSGWSDDAVGSSATRNVKTRTVYRYKDRDEIVEYRFKRTVYGDWSAWSEKAAKSSATLDVQTKEEYVYK